MFRRDSYKLDALYGRENKSSRAPEHSDEYKPFPIRSSMRTCGFIIAYGYYLDALGKSLVYGGSLGAVAHKKGVSWKW